MPSQKKSRPRRRSHHPLRNLILIIAGLMLLGELIYLATHDPDAPIGPNTLTQVEQTEPVTVAEPNTVIHIAAAGDLNVTDAVISAGQLPDGTYDFSPVFMDVVPVLAQADAAVLNLEGTLCGAPYGSQKASAPQELANALAQAGVDVVQTANSYSISNGLLGLTDTIKNLHAAGLQHVGTAVPQQANAAGSFLMQNVGGIRVAFVAFTKGMDNLGLPDGSEGSVNLLYKDYATTYHQVASDSIRSLLQQVAEAQPDYTIALLHWGSEYNDEIADSQETIRSILFDNGVDAIIGTHPHLVQKVEYDKEKGTFIAYSLGDFWGDATESGSDYSMILDLEITRDNVSGLTTLTDFSYRPIYTLKGEDGSMRVMEIPKALSLYEQGFAGSVSEEDYNSMTRAVERIAARIEG